MCHKGGEKAADSSWFGESSASASTGGTKHDWELKNENLRLLVAAGIGLVGVGTGSAGADPVPALIVLLFEVVK